ncbi:hypothetical protein KIN20_032238 [Parelaphostrongylus tenuis]|uniref:Uncharacterized protein n=1 Tax=Parelaphostrongylus tenuis TaxID=148309 RepID=A0AAD5WIC9_PARTN|nr:hypothetical protein KIN20_032238 [Parelaphostrongylus tenuis]
MNVCSMSWKNRSLPYEDFGSFVSCGSFCRHPLENDKGFAERPCERKEWGASSCKSMPTAKNAMRFAAYKHYAICCL